MSTPMFIREPVAGGSTFAATLLITLIAAVDEATLIEEVRITAADLNTDAGELLVYLHDPDAGVDIMAHREAFGATGAADRMHAAASVNITIPVGWSLKAKHTVKVGGVASNADVIALGGIVR